MKKLIVIPIMFIYLLAVSGVTISMHYCGSELESWQVYSANDEGCATDSCSDDMDEEEGCCKNEVVAAKVTIDHYFSDFFKLKLSASEWLAPQKQIVHCQQSVLVAGKEKPTVGNPNAPPGLWQNIPLFKLHSSLTYYG